MPQQINLHTPVLLTQRRYFSAHAMAASLLVFALGLAGLTLWLQHSTRATRAELEHTLAGIGEERARLALALGARPADTAATLQQALQALQAEHARQRELVAELRRGLRPSGQGHSALLRMLAQSLPARAWLTEVRLADQRLEVSGETLDAALLQPWIDTLATQALLAGQPLAALRVEQRPSEPGRAERWGFTLVNAPAAPGLATTVTALDGAAR
jgi:Tfp pilus assembly protein PilN